MASKTVLLLSALIATTMAGSLEKVSQGNTAFTNKIFEQLVKKDGNVFFSPLSMHAVLSMAFQGAGGNTAKQMETALGVDTRTASEGYNSLMGSLNSIENVTLHLANKIYLHNKYTLKQSFHNAVTKDMLSEVEPINFGDNEPAANNINGWCRAKTNNKIDNLVKANDLNADTRLVLLNAIYFKGNWADQFKKDFTKKRPFYITPTQTVDVDMMFRSGKYRYGENQELDSQVIQLPYTNRDVSMIVILPHQKDGIHELEKKLVNYDLTQISKNLREETVELSLPKFKVETEMDLKDVWSAVGLDEMFSSRADFSNMLESPEPLVVSKAIQKAFIEVNEEGAEAAAVTGMMAVACCAIINPQEFILNVDHPFIFYLTSQTEDFEQHLFGGRIMNPQ